MKRKRGKLSVEQRSALIWQYRRSVPLKTIAHRFNVSPAYVSRVANAEGLCRYSKASHSRKSRSISTPVTLPHSNLWLGQGTVLKSEK